MFRIAAFNVENLFDRARAFNEPRVADAQRAIGAVAELNQRFESDRYSAATRRRILTLVDTLELNRFNEGPLALVRTIRGKLLRRPRGGATEVVAAGRGDWIGWAELKMTHVNEVAVENTARVIRDVDADILAVVEAENRVVLQQFTDSVLDRVREELPADERPDPYANHMLIDGNVARGIDVGLMTKPGFAIGEMHSHIHDRDAAGVPVFSRDCPEYAVTTPAGERIWVLPNHFKSKFGSNQAASDRKRRRQAERTAELYRALRDAGERLVVVLGDLNDTPGSTPLRPLLTRTELRDVSEHPNFDPGEFNAGPRNTDRGIGTYRLGNDDDKIDYLLLSPSLFERVGTAGLFRKGAWPGSRPPRWEVYPQVARKVHVASDHHVIWADVES